MALLKRKRGTAVRRCYYAGVTQSSNLCTSAKDVANGKPSMLTTNMGAGRTQSLDLQTQTRLEDYVNIRMDHVHGAGQS
jgi:hypothetical protein